MNIDEAANKLGISVRHARRLIKSGALPAKKVKVKKVIEVEAWDVDSGIVDAASNVFQTMASYDTWGEWMRDTAKRAGLTPQALSKRTKLSMAILSEWARLPHWSDGVAVETQERIGDVLVRAEIERLAASTKQGSGNSRRSRGKAGQSTKVQRVSKRKE